MREKYVDTLAKLYDSATTVYAKKQYTQWYDTKEGGYTYSDFKKKCEKNEISMNNCIKQLIEKYLDQI